MSNVIQNIATGLGTLDYIQNIDSSRGEQLELELANVCDSLGNAYDITEGKADIEFLVNIVAAYIISSRSNKLTTEDKPPSVLFNDRLFPMLDKEVPEEEVIDGSIPDS